MSPWFDPQFEPICQFTIQVGPPQDVGQTGGGLQKIIPILGGSVAGPRISGKILPVGADWQMVEADGLARLDARYAIATADGGLIEVQCQGLRHAPPGIGQQIADGKDVPFAQYYMRGHIRLTSGHPDYRWVNRSLFLATGGKRPSGVELHIFRLA